MKNKSFYKINIITKSYEKTCPQCKKQEGNILNEPLFRYNEKGWGLTCNFCGWEERKDKNIYSHFF